MKKLNRCVVCNSITSNKLVCNRKCLSSYMSNTQKGKNNNSFKNGKYIKKTVNCSFCNKITNTPIGSKFGFCNLRCKAEWQKIHLVGSNNPSFGIKRTDLIKYNKNRIFTDEIKEKIRKYTISQYKSGIFKFKDTKPERIVEQLLKEKQIKYIKQYPYKLGIADFYLPDSNTIIEVNGDYWHNLPGAPEKDKIKYNYLLNNGYNLKVIWESDIKKGIIGI